MSEVVSDKEIGGKILLLRGKRVMLDADLAELYQVPTKSLNRAARRNIERFPEDFMFELTATEKGKVVTNCDHLYKLKFSPYLPLAFTEHGVAMLSSVLNSKRAILVNIQIMRAFVAFRRAAMTYIALKRKIDGIEKKYDGQFAIVFEAIRKLIEPPPEKPRRYIGFKETR